MRTSSGVGRCCASSRACRSAASSAVSPAILLVIAGHRRGRAQAAEHHGDDRVERALLGLRMHQQVPLQERERLVEQRQPRLRRAVGGVSQRAQALDVRQQLAVLLPQRLGDAGRRGGGHDGAPTRTMRIAHRSGPSSCGSHDTWPARSAWNW